MHNNFAENLKKIRKENNLSQEQLAEELGVSRQAISKWESASAYPEMDKIIALCDKFNLNIDDLLHKDIKEIKGEDDVKKKQNKYINDFLKFITDTINLFSNMNFKSKIKCLIEQIVIIGILFVAGIGIYFFSKYVISGIFGFLPFNISHPIISILDYIILIFVEIVAIIIFLHIFKTRYLDYYNKLKQETLEKIDESENIKLEKNSINEDNNNKIIFKNNENKIIIRDPKHSEYKFINGLMKLIVQIIKILTLFISVSFCLILIFLFCCFILSFAIWKTGILFVGLLMAILSASLVDIIFILIIFNFVFNRKSNKKNMIWLFILSLIGLGISSGLILLGTLNFKVVKDDDLFKTETIQFKMEDNLFFDVYQDIEFIETDIDNIQLEYKVINLFDVKSYKTYNNRVYLHSFCSDPINLIKEIINNLNDKKIISFDSELVDIKIYASKENIEKIKNNEKEYYLKQENYNNQIEYYENLIDDYQNTIDTNNDKIFELEMQIENYKEQLQMIQNYDE